MQEQYLTAKETAEKLGVTYQHLANLRSKGKGLPYYKKRGEVFYKLADVEEYDSMIPA